MSDSPISNWSDELLQRGGMRGRLEGFKSGYLKGFKSGFFQGRREVQSQFSCPCRVRIVETKWPEKEGRKARSTYMIQIYVDKELKWEFGITGTIFLKAFLEALEGGDLGPQFKPVENIPYANEIEPKENDLQEANPGEAPAPQDPGEPLPF